MKGKSEKTVKSFEMSEGNTAKRRRMADVGERTQGFNSLLDFSSFDEFAAGSEFAPPQGSSEMQTLNAMPDQVSSRSSGPSRSREVSANEFAAEPEFALPQGSSEMQVAVRYNALMSLLGHLFNAKQRLDKALAEVENELDSAMAEVEKIEGLQIQQRREEREHLKQMLQLGAKASLISSLSPRLTHSHRRSSSMNSKTSQPLHLPLRLCSISTSALPLFLAS